MSNFDATCVFCIGERCALCDITREHCDHDVIDRHGDLDCADEPSGSPLP